ncbi:MAG: class I mannose-6-phosphate isomerase [Proteobacteria bacterium]|nr:class I mannose-6-phosphate isomerase [Pseudomonadota bacterium]
MNQINLSKDFFAKPIRLNPKNFTSLKKTPWAGSVLSQTIKQSVAESPGQTKIGESWEVSCDPAMESTIQDIPNLSLSQAICQNPIEALSPQQVKIGRDRLDILIKLINADQPLSLQIHPADGHPMLKTSECGKPESWLVLNASPGAGIYLGFSKEFKLNEIHDSLKSGQFNESMLQFVPVKKGDFFEIEPGVPHAIGPGSVLFEPQRIQPGASGITWRMWDWNRRYDKNGNVDPLNGTPRDLHIEQSMSLLHPQRQWGPKYLGDIRKTPMVQNTSSVEISAYPGNSFYQVINVKMRKNAKVSLSQEILFSTLSMIQGGILAQTQPNGTRFETLLSLGESALLPWRALPAILHAHESEAEFVLVIPSSNYSTDSIKSWIKECV